METGGPGRKRTAAKFAQGVSMRGRKPKPTALRVIQGNPGKRPLPKGEPNPSLARSPEPPAWLDEDGRAEWERVVPELEAIGMLAVVDLAMLAAYCQHIGRMVRAERELAEHVARAGSLMVVHVNKAGAENLVPHPAIKVARESAALARAIAAEFGFTPSSRVRLSTGAKEADDPFEEFLKRRSTG